MGVYIEGAFVPPQLGRVNFAFNFNLNSRLAARNKLIDGFGIKKTIKSRRRRSHGKRQKPRQEFEPPFYVLCLSILNYVVLGIFGFLREIYGILGITRSRGTHELAKYKKFAPLYSFFEGVYYRHMYRQVQDTFHRPICSAPGPTIQILDRISNDHGWTQELTGTKTDLINMGSYNYLGFAGGEENNKICVKETIETLRQNGSGIGSSREELGMLPIHRELETSVAGFLGTEDAMCFAMGFATNSMNIPAIMGKDCLILSDRYNHSSLALGCRLSNAKIVIFKHNDPRDLERKLRKNLREGFKISGKPFKKILIMVEGIYSMEGTICNLPEMIRIKKKYKAYLYMDEAHSIGALGRNGRGVCDYWGCNPSDVDILMGTFTKAMSAAGGYIAGKKELINHLRATSHNIFYGTPLSPPVAQQIITAIKQIESPEGLERINKLAENTRYFRQELARTGAIITGDPNSPVIPLMLFYPTKAVAFSREMLALRIAVVIVGYPATPMTGTRARFCISAAHTKEMLDEVVGATKIVVEKINAKF